MVSDLTGGRAHHLGILYPARRGVRSTWVVRGSQGFWFEAADRSKVDAEIGTAVMGHFRMTGLLTLQ